MVNRLEVPEDLASLLEKREREDRRAEERREAAEKVEEDRRKAADRRTAVRREDEST